MAVDFKVVSENGFKMVEKAIASKGSDDFKSIIKILEYLTPDELLIARLVNPSFNEIITGNPTLLWGKNMMRVHFTPDMDSGSAWKNLRLQRLVVQYNCPNFHFFRTNLLSDGAINFFQSSVRYQIKHLKITKCRITRSFITYITNCCSKTLEHLEIVDFSKMENCGGLGDPEVPTSLQNLKTLIFDNTNGKGMRIEVFEGPLEVLPQSFLLNLFSGVRRLTTIRFTGWGAKTFENLFNVLSYTAEEGNLQDLETLDLECKIEEDFSSLQQYSFVMGLEAFQLPRLVRFSLCFDKNVEPSADLTEDWIQDLTECVATFIESISLTLKEVKFINCPLSSAVFRKGADFFPKLVKVTTIGTRILKFDQDANPIYSNRSMKTQKSKSRIRRIVDSTFGGNDSNLMSDKYAYTYFCTLCALAVGIHYFLRHTFPPTLAEHLENFLLAFVAVVVVKGKEIKKRWKVLKKTAEVTDRTNIVVEN